MTALMTWVGWMVAAVLVVGLGLVVSAAAGGLNGLATMLAVSGGALLVMAWIRGRRGRGEVRVRHCLECGASVAEGASVCPRCQSVQLDKAGEGGGGGSSGAGSRRGGGREMPISAYSPDNSGSIGWVDQAPPGSWGAAEGSSPRVLRRWGAGLLAAAIVIAAAAVAARFAAG